MFFLNVGFFLFELQRCVWSIVQTKKIVRDKNLRLEVFDFQLLQMLANKKQRCVWLSCYCQQSLSKLGANFRKRTLKFICILRKNFLISISSRDLKFLQLQKSRNKFRDEIVHESFRKNIFHFKRLTFF